MTWLTESICDQWSQLPIFLGPGAAAGKTYIVTGANVGIGFETSKHLVKASASRVILAVRNIEAGERARVEIEKETGIKGVAEVWHLDLSSFASVKAFATKADWELERLDVLVNNAALAYDQFTLSEGLELSVKVNVASTFLLGALLFPKLSKSGRLHGFQPRLVFVVTALAFAAKDDLYNLQNDKSIFESLNEEKRAKMSTRYAATKLMQIHVVRQLAATFPVEQTDVIITMVDPGLCKTSLARDTKTVNRAMVSTLRVIMGRTAEEGSRTLLHAIVSEDHGKFHTGCKIKEHWIQPWMTDETGQKLQAKIWMELKTLLEGIEPGCFSHETLMGGT
ncbi:NAD(P)-binding protein [Sarocladium strictum]